MFSKNLKSRFFWGENRKIFCEVRKQKNFLGTFIGSSPGDEHRSHWSRLSADTSLTINPHRDEGYAPPIQDCITSNIFITLRHHQNVSILIWLCNKSRLGSYCCLMAHLVGGWGNEVWDRILHPLQAWLSKKRKGRKLNSKEKEKIERKRGEKKANKNKATLLVSTYKGFFVRVVRLKALLVPCSFKLFLIGSLLYTTLFHIYACVKNWLTFFWIWVSKVFSNRTVFPYKKICNFLAQHDNLTSLKIY